MRIEYSKPSDNLFWVHFGKAVPAHQKKYSSQFHPEFRDKDELEALVTCSPLQASGGAFLFPSSYRAQIPRSTTSQSVPVLRRVHSKLA